MPDPYALTELQLAILHVLWDRGEATSRQVRDALEPRRSLALTTVATLLSRLEKRGVLSHRRSGRSYVFTPTVTRGEVREVMVRDLADNLFDGDPVALMQHLIRDAADAEELARVQTILDEANGGAKDLPRPN